MAQDGTEESDRLVAAGADGAEEAGSENAADAALAADLEEDAASARPAADKLRNAAEQVRMCLIWPAK